MAKAKYALIDTSAWIDYFRSDGNVKMRQSVTATIEQGAAAWCECVMLELMRGNIRQRKQAELIGQTLPCLSIDAATWQEAYRLSILASEKGKPVPNTDILIYACAKRHKATVLHRDKHFSMLETL